MINLNKKELLEINGGLKISAVLFSTAVKGFSLILELGRSVGTSIRRLQTKQLC